MTITFDSLVTRINTITAAERVTKAELGLLSREVLSYILESEDVRPVNMLLGKDEEGKFVLTVNNRRVAGLYFQEFVPFTSEEKDGVLVFLKKKAKVFEKYTAAINNFLGEGSNDIWTWAETNVEVQAKPKFYAEKITKLIQKSLEDEAEGISKVDVMKAVLDAGLSIEDLLEIGGLLGAAKNEKAA